MTIPNTTTSTAHHNTTTPVVTGVESSSVPIVDAIPLADDAIVVQGKPFGITSSTIPSEQPNDVASSTPALAAATAEDDDEAKTVCCGMKRKKAITLVVVTLGVFVLLIAGGWGLAEIKEDSYVCGSAAPSQEYLNRTGLPVCLQVSVNMRARHKPQRPLCLAKPAQEENSNDPPMWCYKDHEDDYYDDGFYLWWSPCTTCGTAWRMFKEKKDDESWYKLPTNGQKPSATARPPFSLSSNSSDSDSNEEWLAWSMFDGWQNQPVYFTDCSSADSTSIPEECYQEDNKFQTPGLVLKVAGIVGLILSMAAACFGFGASNGCSGGDRGHGTSGGFFGGGGCGGGGGGCGGGGGGCGGGC